MADIHQAQLKALMEAANFLDIPSLLELTCAKVRRRQCLLRSL
jgi:hypothetical protein